MELKWAKALPKNVSLMFFYPLLERANNQANILNSHPISFQLGNLSIQGKIFV